MILRHNVQVWDCLILGIADLNPTDRIGDFLSCLLRVVKSAKCRSPFRRNPTARVCVCACVCLITCSIFLKEIATYTRLGFCPHKRFYSYEFILWQAFQKLNAGYRWIMETVSMTYEYILVLVMLDITLLWF